MKEQWRSVFLRWLSFKVFKTSEGAIPNKFVRFMQHMLYPIEFIYNNQYKLRKDLYSQNYYIDGYKISFKELYQFLKEKGTNV